jgi:hypothetical protein
MWSGHRAGRSAVKRRTRTWLRGRRHETHHDAKDSTSCGLSDPNTKRARGESKLMLGCRQRNDQRRATGGPDQPTRPVFGRHCAGLPATRRPTKALVRRPARGATVCRLCNSSTLAGRRMKAVVGARSFRPASRLLPAGCGRHGAAIKLADLFCCFVEAVVGRGAGRTEPSVLPCVPV